MICQRCGYCCIGCDIVIPIPTTKKNVAVGAYKPYDMLCWNLSFEDDLAICKIHESKIYKKSPCDCHTQAEEDESTPCRMGIFMLSEGRELLDEKRILPVAVPEPIEISIK